MSLAAIALNRFGLGARPSDAAPADPRGWLLGQLGRFDPRPAVITALPNAAAMTLRYRQNLAQLRRQGLIGARRPGDPEAPRGPEAEAMDGQPGPTRAPPGLCPGLWRAGRCAVDALAHQRDPICRTAGAFLGQSFRHFHRQAGHRHHGRPVGVRSHPPQHRRPVQRNAAGRHPSSGDAILSRSGAIDRPEQPAG
jgi:hypothetical protein